MVSSCCAFGCKNRFKKNGGIGFFKFPRNPVQRKLWTLALRRKNFVPTRASVVCGEHFQTGRPSKDSEHPDYVPNIFNFNPSKKSNVSNKRMKPCEIRIKNLVNESSTPAISTIINLEKFPTSLTYKAKELSRIEVEIPKQIIGLQQEYAEVNALMHDKAELQVDSEAKEVSKNEEELLNLKLELQHVRCALHTMTEESEKLVKKLSSAHVTESILQNSMSEKEEELLKLKRELQQVYAEVNALRGEKEELQKKLSATDITQGILQDPRKLHFYTGLNSVKDFHLILSLFSSVVNDVKSISLETQVLMILMKLKLNLWIVDLAYRFHTSRSTAHRICVTLIPFLKTKLDLLVRSPINNALKKNIPVCFKNTVYENLYQRLLRNYKFKTKQPENRDTDLDIVQI